MTISRQQASDLLSQYKSMLNTAQQILSNILRCTDRKDGQFFKVLISALEAIAEDKPDSFTASLHGLHLEGKGPQTAIEIMLPSLETHYIKHKSLADLQFRLSEFTTTLATFFPKPLTRITISQEESKWLDELAATSDPDMKKLYNSPLPGRYLAPEDSRMFKTLTVLALPLKKGQLSFAEPTGFYLYLPPDLVSTYNDTLSTATGFHRLRERQQQLALQNLTLSDNSASLFGNGSTPTPSPEPSTLTHKPS